MSYIESFEEEDDNFEIISSSSSPDNRKYEFVCGAEFAEIKGLHNPKIHSYFISQLFHAEGKSIILDAFALLGGNENLVYKILVELEGTSYR